MAGIAAILTDSANRWAADTKILLPDDDGFAGATRRWAIHKPPTYSAVISPATEEDVVKAVSSFEVELASFGTLHQMPATYHDTIIN